MYSLELVTGVEVLLKNEVRSDTPGNACLFDAQPDLPHLFNPHFFTSQITAALTDLGMLEEVRIEWGPGAALHKPNGEISLDLDCIVVLKRMWSSWPSPSQHTRRAEDYLRCLAIPRSQPFTRTQQDWNWKNE